MTDLLWPAIGHAENNKKAPRCGHRTQGLSQPESMPPVTGNLVCLLAYPAGYFLSIGLRFDGVEPRSDKKQDMNAA
jgi:hypothetical protein